MIEPTSRDIGRAVEVCKTRTDGSVARGTIERFTAEYVFIRLDADALRAGALRSIPVRREELDWAVPGRRDGAKL